MIGDIRHQRPVYVQHDFQKSETLIEVSDLAYNHQLLQKTMLVKNAKIWD